MSSRISYALVVILLLCAAGLRIWNLTTVPHGMSNPEFANVLLMQDSIQQGDIRVFYEINGEGQEGLYHSTLAFASVVFGTGTLGFRILSVFVGVLTIALMYSLSYRLLGYWGGLAATALLATTMWPVLLSRLILVETMLPLLAVAILLALARAFPVYERHRIDSSSTVDFAVLGFLLGIGLYLHPSGLMMVLASMVFIAYIVLTIRPLPVRRLSYIGFAILMMIITSMPYLITTIRLPEYNAGVRIIGDYGGIIASVIDGFLGLFVEGDMNPLYNIPGRPMLDPLSGIFIMIGLGYSLLKWREPRYALILIAGFFFAPAALLTDDSPSFLGLSLLFPIVALLFGLGFSRIVGIPKKALRSFVLFCAVIAVLVNIGWTYRDVQRWAEDEQVQIAYHSKVGLIAQYLDRTAGDLQTVFCYPDWHVERPLFSPLSAAEQILLLMNRPHDSLRYVDCRTGLIITEGGASQQVIIPSTEIYQQLPQVILDWLTIGTQPQELPPGTVTRLDIQDYLADALGVYTTTTPASFVTEIDLSERIPVPPPIRFGGNLTWLGYEIPPDTSYAPGEIASVVTYWRVEGLVPSDLTLFTHVLSDPITPAAQHDTISVNPKDLRARDVFIQITNIPLPDNMLEGSYDISIGAYQATSDIRLPVLNAEGQEQGTRIFLYAIEVANTEE